MWLFEFDKNSFSTTWLRFYGVQLLGRTIDLRSLIVERMNKLFRENLEFLFDRFESQDLCAIVVSSFTLFSGFLLTIWSAFFIPYSINRRLIWYFILGIREVGWCLKAYPWIAIQRPFNRLVQSYNEWDAREFVSCVIF